MTLRTCLILSLLAHGTVFCAATFRAPRATMPAGHAGAMRLYLVALPGNLDRGSDQARVESTKVRDSDGQDEGLPNVLPDPRGEKREPQTPQRGERGQGERDTNTVSVGQGEGMDPSMVDFLQEVRTRLEASKRYPRLARRLGQEGTARLRFAINRSGDADHLHLIQSSGWDALDREALALVKRAGRFPRLPVLFKEYVNIQVPVVFQLNTP